MKSLENDRDLDLHEGNPFNSEIRLYEKTLEGGDVIATVAVPDFYHIALPNLGHQMVEKQLNDIPGVFADRTYLSRSYGLLKEEPRLVPDIVFISMSYNGSYIRSLRTLDLMGIPLCRSDRMKGDPLVVFGGWSVTRNPLPLFEIADAIGVGDSEHLVEAIILAYQQNRDSRQQMFDALVQERGVIIPSRYNVTTENGYLTSWEVQRAPHDIYPSESVIFPHSWYLSSETDYNDIGYYEGKTFFSMEIVDACDSKCLFCSSGFRNKTRDVRDPLSVADLAESGVSHGADLAKLFFPANSSLEATKDIMKELMRRGIPPRVGSAKAERIDTEYIELVGRAGQEKIAFAPETGDYELRKRLGKPGMTEKVLERVITTSIASGIPNLDFYLIMNLPGEASDSFQKTIDLIGRFHHLAQSGGLQGRVRISAPNFFPQARTPFQYAAAGSLDLYQEKIDKLERDLGGLIAISNMRGNVDLLSQNILSRGGTEAGVLMLEVYRRLRQRESVSGSFVPDTIDDWRVALTAVGIDEQVYFSEKSVDKPLPWEHIHTNNIRTNSLVKAWDVFRNRRSIVVLD